MQKTKKEETKMHSIVLEQCVWPSILNTRMLEEPEMKNWFLFRRLESLLKNRLNPLESTELMMEVLGINSKKNFKLRKEDRVA